MSRIRANNITNGAGTGAPIFPHGAIINGIATITSDVSSFSNLSVNKVSLGTGTTLSGEDNNALKILTNGSERVTVSAGGSVGIGTSSPNVPLEINAETPRIRLVRTSTGVINEIRNNGNQLSIRADTGDIGANSRIEFQIDGSERLRVGPEGQIGLGGANYGTAGQVLKSNGNSTAPTWQNLSQFYFYGEQDATQSIANATYTRIKNLGTSAVNIGISSIAVWDESNGTLTIGADGAGLYFLYCTVGIDDLNNPEYCRAVIGKNGDTTDIGTRLSTYMDAYNPGSNKVTTSQVSTIANLSANDVVRFFIYHNEGATTPTEANRTCAMGYKLN